MGETLCANCNRAFAEHDPTRECMCPVKVEEMVYGYFCGGDPRLFHPDMDDCSQEEIAFHKRACQIWDDAEERGETPEPENSPSGWIYDENTGKRIIHVLRAPYGIGSYTYMADSFWDVDRRQFDESV